MTAVPSAVRGLTALCEMEEVTTRLTSTNLMDSCLILPTQLPGGGPKSLLSFFLQRETLSLTGPCAYYLRPGIDPVKLSTQHTSGAISTARLNASPHLHLPPINVVVYNTPLYRNTHLQASFALRCFQRLSDPHVATRPCLRPNNRFASGESIPVLSY